MVTISYQVKKPFRQDLHTDLHKQFQERDFRDSGVDIKYFGKRHSNTVREFITYTVVEMLELWLAMN